jgi:hypothetical protein
MRIALVAMAMSVVLVGCMSDQPRGPSSRERGSCVIGGCSAELCADQPLISSCIWHEVYVCYETALCGRQPDGTCGWNPTPELTACIAAHPN